MTFSFVMIAHYHRQTVDYNFVSNYLEKFM